MADWSEKWYKEKFHDMEAKPSSENWEEISAQMDEWPSHWYKSNVEDLKLKPKPDLWDKISADLVPPSVGVSLSHGFFIRSTFAFLLIMLVPLSISNFQDSQSFVISERIKSGGVDNNIGNLTPKATPSEVATEEYNSQKENDLLVREESNSDQADAKYENVQRKEQVNNSLASKEQTDQRELFAENQVKKNDNQITTTSSTPEEIKMTPKKSYSEQSTLPLTTVPATNNLVTQYYNKSIIEISDQPYKAKNKWALGVGIKPQISTLFNPITLNAVRGENQIVMKPGFNVTYALSMTRKISTGHFIDFNLELNNRKTHQYTKTSFGEQQNKFLDLNYITAEFVHRKKSSKIFQQYSRLSFSTIKGLYGAYLTSASETNNSEGGLHLKDGFRNFDIGISLGIESSYYINTRTEFYAGIKTQIGTMGVFKGTEIVPANFFFNSTSSTGVFIGFRQFF